MNKLRQLMPQRIIASVPSELEEQFIQVQLKTLFIGLKLWLLPCSPSH